MDTMKVFLRKGKKEEADGCKYSMAGKNIMKLPTLYAVVGVKKIEQCSVSVTLILIENRCSEGDP